jgi:hypothetical protein
MTDAREIEREVDAERQRVSETIDALQRKVSVGSIVDQVVKSVGEHGGEVSHNLAVSLRQNPMAVLLTGVGLVWLIAGGGPRAGRPDWERDDRWRERVSGTSPEAGDPLAPFGDEDPAHRAFGEHPGSESGPGFGQRLAGAAGSVSEGVGAAAGSVSEGVGAAAGELREGYARVGETVSRLAGRAGEAAHRAAGYAPGMGDVRHRLARGGQSSLRGLEAFLDEQPLVAGALALALGAAIGSALPRTRTEDELFGEESDRLKQSLRATAEEEGGRLARSAAAVADEARAMVGEASEELARGGSSVVERMDQAIDDAAERLKRRAGEGGVEDATEPPADAPHEHGAGKAPPREKRDDDETRPGFPR